MARKNKKEIETYLRRKGILILRKSEKLRNSSEQTHLFISFSKESKLGISLVFAELE